MRGQEANYLAGQLQGGHPSIEVDPIEALQIQTHVPIEDVVDGDHAGRHRGASGERRRTTPPACSHRTATSPAKPSTTSAVRGEASLVNGSRSRRGEWSSILRRPARHG